MLECWCDTSGGPSAYFHQKYKLAFETVREKMEESCSVNGGEVSLHETIYKFFSVSLSLFIKKNFSLRRYAWRKKNSYFFTEGNEG